MLFKSQSAGSELQARGLEDPRGSPRWTSLKPRRTPHVSTSPSTRVKKREPEVPSHQVSDIPDITKTGWGKELDMYIP